MMNFAGDNLISALVMMGEWDAAEETFEACLQDVGTDTATNLAFPVVFLRAFRGDGAGLEPVVACLRRLGGSEDPQDLGVLRTALAVVALADGDPGRALHEATPVLDFAAVLGVASEPVRWAWLVAAEAALALGDRGEVRRLLDWLDAHPPGHIPRMLRADRLRIRARLAAAEQDVEATSAFEAATTALRELGSPYHLAVGLVDHGEHLVSTGDRRGAEPLLAEASEIAARLHAQPLLDRAERLATAAHAAPAVALIRAAQPAV